MDRAEFMAKVAKELSGNLLVSESLAISAALNVIRGEVNRMFVNDQEFGNAAGWNGALDKVNNMLIALRSAPSEGGDGR